MLPQCLAQQKENDMTKENAQLCGQIDLEIISPKECFFTALHRHAVDWKFDISTLYARVDPGRRPSMLLASIIISITISNSNKSFVPNDFH